MVKVPSTTTCAREPNKATVWFEAAEGSGGLNQIRWPGRRCRRPATRDRELILLSRKRACSYVFHPEYCNAPIFAGVTKANLATAPPNDVCVPRVPRPMPPRRCRAETDNRASPLLGSPPSHLRRKHASYLPCPLLLALSARPSPPMATRATAAAISAAPS